MKCCCVKMADEVVGKSRSNGSITKARTTFSEEETENLISLWSEEEVLFNSRHKDYFKKDVRQNAINRILLRLNKQVSPLKANCLKQSADGLLLNFYYHCKQ